MCNCQLLILIFLCGVASYASANTPLPQNPQWIQVGIGSQFITYVDVRSIQRSYHYQVLDGVRQELPTITAATAWVLNDNMNLNEDGSIFLYDAGKNSWHKYPMNPRVLILSWAYKVDFDCIHNQQKALEVVMYSGHMAAGKIVNSQDASASEWSSGSPTNTYDHTIEEIACNGFPYGYVKQTQ